MDFVRVMPRSRIFSSCLIERSGIWTSLCGQVQGPHCQLVGLDFAKMIRGVDKRGEVGGPGGDEADKSCSVLTMVMPRLLRRPCWDWLP